MEGNSRISHSAKIWIPWVKHWRGKCVRFCPTKFCETQFLWVKLSIWIGATIPQGEFAVEYLRHCCKVKFESCRGDIAVPHCEFTNMCLHFWSARVLSVFNGIRKRGVVEASVTFIRVINYFLVITAAPLPENRLSVAMNIGRAEGFEPATYGFATQRITTQLPRAIILGRELFKTLLLHKQRPMSDERSGREGAFWNFIETLVRDARCNDVEVKSLVILNLPR